MEFLQAEIPPSILPFQSYPDLRHLRLPADLRKSAVHPGLLRLPMSARAYGDDRVRTDDPLLAKQVLSRLSYVPSGQWSAASGQTASDLTDRWSLTTDLVGQGGFEPPTPRLSSVCSNQLSY